MNKHLTIFFYWLAVILCGTQVSAQVRADDGVAAARVQNANSQTTSPQQKTALQKDILQDVLFATNADCRVFINNEVKGVVSKDRFFYLKLAPGTYHFIARNDSTGDEWRDQFTLGADKPAEVFIDMLYTIDAGTELRMELARAASANNSTTNPLSSMTDEAGQKAIIQQIVADMVPIAGGTFVMGNNKSPSKDEAEHPVMLTPFFMNKFEVSQEQWAAIMGQQPSLNKGCAVCPVENVSWEDVMIFLRKINSISNHQFRLPTEAEWEYVARMGGKEEIETAGGAEAYIQKAAWAYLNSGNRSHPVGKKQPNVAGIYDLFGNVSEWCMDWYGAFFFQEDFTEKDPEGPPLGKDKIIRGGNYKDYQGDRFRPSFRNKANPKTKTSEIGFRLVMERKKQAP